MEIFIQGCANDMDIYDAWSGFIETGSVIDYLRYTSLRDAQKDNLPEYFRNNNESVFVQEDKNEADNGRTDNR